MKAKIRQRLAARKRRIQRRLDKTRFGSECPVISASNIQYDIAERTHAIAAGGIGLIHQMVKRLELDDAIIEADGTMVETGGECKRGIDINYKGQWGYHPLMVSLANRVGQEHLGGRLQGVDRRVQRLSCTLAG